MGVNSVVLFVILDMICFIIACDYLFYFICCDFCFDFLDLFIVACCGLFVADLCLLYCGVCLSCFVVFWGGLMLLLVLLFVVFRCLFLLFGFGLKCVG